jgi:hypothetical protein
VIPARAGRRTLLLALGCLLPALPAAAQLVIKLKPDTVEQFEAYVHTAEADMDARWKMPDRLILVQSDPAELQKVLSGEVYIRSVSPNGPVSIKDGLIHDWIGTVFIPNAAPDKVVGILRNFDVHKKIYPEVVNSRTVRQAGDEVEGYWRLRRKGVVSVVLDVTQKAFWTEIAPGRWICRAHADDVREVDTGLFSNGRVFPLGEGHGYMWRLDAYWALEAYRGGVLAECRTISLSRDIPDALNWAIAPYVKKAPQDSLFSTLSNTRKAATR